MLLAGVQTSEVARTRVDVAGVACLPWASLLCHAPVAARASDAARLGFRLSGSLPVGLGGRFHVRDVPARCQAFPLAPLRHGAAGSGFNDATLSLQVGMAGQRAARADDCGCARRNNDVHSCSPRASQAVREHGSASGRHGVARGQANLSRD